MNKEHFSKGNSNTTLFGMITLGTLIGFFLTFIASIASNDSFLKVISFLFLTSFFLSTFYVSAIIVKLKFAEAKKKFVRAKH